MTSRTTRLAAAVAILAFLVSGVALADETPRTTQPADGTSEAELRETVRLENIRKAEAAYRVRSIVGRAERAEAAGRDAEAAELYAQAVELEPVNAKARLGLQATRDRLGLVTERLPLIERTERESNIRRQEILFRFNAAIAAATEGIVSGKPEGFQKARLEIDRARIVRDSDPAVFSTEGFADLDARLRDHETALSTAMQRRADAVERARQKERARRIKAARVHDLRLEL